MPNFDPQSVSPSLVSTPRKWANVDKAAGDVTLTNAPGALSSGVRTANNTDGIGTYGLAFYVGTAGDLILEDIDGQRCTFKNVVAGMWHGFGGLVKKIIATGTTAVDIRVGYHP